MLPQELVASYHGYKTDTKFTTWLPDKKFRDTSHLHSAESLRLSSNIRQEILGAKEIQTKGPSLTATPASNFRIGLTWGNKSHFQHFSTLEHSSNLLSLDISRLMPAHRPDSTTYRHQNITNPQHRQLTPTRFSFSSQIPH